MQRTEKYFENDAFRKTAAGVILAAEADAKTGGGRGSGERGMKQPGELARSCP